MIKKYLPQIILIAAILIAAWFGRSAILSIAPKKAAAEEEAEEKPADADGALRVELTPEKRKAAGLEILPAGPATIRNLLPLYGKIAINEEGMGHVMARFPGIIKEVYKRLGENVTKDDVLAIVESNESLRSYQITAPATGTITAKDAAPGEFVKDDMTLFTVSDLSSVWVDLSVFRQDFKLLKVGEALTLHIGGDSVPIQTKIDYISPFGSQGTQTMLARCVVPNPDGDLRPGLFVDAEVATGEVAAPVAVKIAAIQTIHEKTVVFVEEGEGFDAREVELGQKDTEHVQIVKGLSVGDKYVSGNSFILKAEIGKSEAEEE